METVCLPLLYKLDVHTAGAGCTRQSISQWPPADSSSSDHTMSDMSASGQCAELPQQAVLATASSLSYDSPRSASQTAGASSSSDGVAQQQTSNASGSGGVADHQTSDEVGSGGMAQQQTTDSSGSDGMDNQLPEFATAQQQASGTTSSDDMDTGRRSFAAPFSDLLGPDADEQPATRQPARFTESMPADASPALLQALPRLLRRMIRRHAAAAQDDVDSEHEAGVFGYILLGSWHNLAHHNMGGCHDSLCCQGCLLSWLVSAGRCITSPAAGVVQVAAQDDPAPGSGHSG